MLIFEKVSASSTSSSSAEGLRNTDARLPSGGDGHQSKSARVDTGSEANNPHSAPVQDIIISDDGGDSTWSPDATDTDEIASTPVTAFRRVKLEGEEKHQEERERPPEAHPELPAQPEACADGNVDASEKSASYTSGN